MPNSPSFTKSDTLPSAARRTILRRCTLDTKNAFEAGSYAMPSVSRSFSASRNATALPPTGRRSRASAWRTPANASESLTAAKSSSWSEPRSSLRAINPSRVFAAAAASPLRACAQARL